MVDTNGVRVAINVLLWILFKLFGWYRVCFEKNCIVLRIPSPIPRTKFWNSARYFWVVLPAIAKKEISLGVPDDADQNIFSLQTQYAWNLIVQLRSKPTTPAPSETAKSSCLTDDGSDLDLSLITTISTEYFCPV